MSYKTMFKLYPLNSIYDNVRFLGEYENNYPTLHQFVHHILMYDKDYHGCIIVTDESISMFDKKSKTIHYSYGTVINEHEWSEIMAKHGKKQILQARAQCGFGQMVDYLIQVEYSESEEKNEESKPTKTRISKEDEDILDKYLRNFQKEHGDFTKPTRTELYHLACCLCDDIPLGYEASHRLASWIFAYFASTKKKLNNLLEKYEKIQKERQEILKIMGCDIQND